MLKYHGANQTEPRYLNPVSGADRPNTYIGVVIKTDATKVTLQEEKAALSVI